MLIQGNAIKLPLKDKKDKSILLCGCPPIGELVIRKYKNGEEVWGYACKCGKVFKARGRLK